MRVSRTQELLRTIMLMAFVMGCASAVQARDAAFTAPDAASSAANPNADAVAVEPKNEIDTGESVIDTARRTTLFFANRSGAPVEIVSITATGDGNVNSDIVSDDCTTQGKIESNSRCSIVVEVTPSAPGAWSVEILMTHKGTGRIARAKLTGKASGRPAANKQDTGLSLSTKEIKPIDFGIVTVDSGKAVRSALMLNDSVEPIVLMSIDVIAAENGLERMEQGCAQDMELKSGESCPVTMVWQPTAKGQISTDLIIRHTGRMGFTVIPLRGVAKEEVVDGATGDRSKTSETSSKSEPPPLSVNDRALLDKIPPLAADMLPTKAVTRAAVSSSDFRLIGTVGNRAILVKSDDSTIIVGVNEEIENGDSPIKVTNVKPKSVELFINGEKKEISIGAASSLTKKAGELAAAERASSPETAPTDKK